MAFFKIGVASLSSQITAAQVSTWIAALQTQVSRDFGPVWGVGCLLLEKAGPGDWPLHIVDAADVKGALGYHDIDSNGVPFIKVFVNESAQAGVPLSAVMSHEVLEVCGDAFIESVVLNDAGDRTGTIYAAEVCDPVEANLYQINGISVSNFITPRWFGTMPGIGSYDFQNKLKNPLTTTPGGYYSYNRVTRNGLSGWGQVLGAKASRWDGGRS